jgi:hypothetical protein
MKKPVTLFILTIILECVLAGCTRPKETTQPLQVTPSPFPTAIPLTSTLTSTITPTITLTSTIIPPTPTLFPSATPTLTPTPLNTIEPAKADELISGLLRDPGDCLAPCFWGIVPGKTTRDEADNFFYHIGALPYNSTIDGKDYASYRYQFKKGSLEIGVTLSLSNNVVENQKIVMPARGTNGLPVSGWMAYSPKALIQRYGKPSRVDFSWNLQGGNLTFTTILYFEKFDLIGMFHSPDGPKPSSPTECPLAVRYDTVWLWMGKDPYYPPGKGIPLIEATSLTIDEFVSLMTGAADRACFTLNHDAFLPHMK